MDEQSLFVNSLRGFLALACVCWATREWILGRGNTRKRWWTVAIAGIGMIAIFGLGVTEQMMGESGKVFYPVQSVRFVEGTNERTAIVDYINEKEVELNIVIGEKAIVRQDGGVRNELEQSILVKKWYLTFGDRLLFPFMKTEYGQTRLILVQD